MGVRLMLAAMGSLLQIVRAASFAVLFLSPIYLETGWLRISGTRRAGKMHKFSRVAILTTCGGIC